MVCPKQPLREYRPRRPRQSPLWQIFKAGYPHYVKTTTTAVARAKRNGTPPQQYPPSTHQSDTIRAYLTCGDLSRGFTKIHCPHCQHHYLLPFSCKQRHLCPSCHQKKIQHESALIAREITRTVPHRQYVFTIPKILRAAFRYHPERHQLLYTTARDTHLAWLRHRLDLPSGRAGLIITCQTFGSTLNYHPHLHILATNGLFDPTGNFHNLPPQTSLAPLAQLLRHTLIQRMTQAGWLPPHLARNLLTWRNSGFNLDDGDPIAATDAPARERVAQYLLRLPFSLDKIHWQPDTRTILYGDRKQPHKQKLFSSNAFIAAILEHLPPKHAQTIRYYGIYSNKTRGRIRLGKEPTPKATIHNTTARNKPTKHWRSLIKKVWEVDPLICPHCFAEMKIISLQDNPTICRQTLRRNNLWDTTIAIPAPRPPPLDVHTCETLPADPATSPIDEPFSWKWRYEPEKVLQKIYGSSRCDDHDIDYGECQLPLEEDWNQDDANQWDQRPEYPDQWNQDAGWEGSQESQIQFEGIDDIPPDELPVIIYD